MESEERTRRGHQGEKMKKKVVELSIQSGVSSCFTAFIAVNKDSSQAVQGPLVRRNIPTVMANLGLAPQRAHVSLRSRLNNYMPSLFRRDNSKATSQLNSFAPIRSRPDYYTSLRSRPDYSMATSQLKFFAPIRSQPDYYTSVQSQPDYCSCVDESALSVDDEQPHKDPLLQLVSLQNASGSWMLHEALAAVLGKTKEEVEKAKPELVNNEVWASILALIWLHGFKMNAKEEWELLAMKAASWIKAQNAPCVSECVEAGNKLLGCSMKKEALGI